MLRWWWSTAALARMSESRLCCSSSGRGMSSWKMEVKRGVSADVVRVQNVAAVEPAPRLLRALQVERHRGWEHADNASEEMRRAFADDEGRGKGKKDGSGRDVGDGRERKSQHVYVALERQQICEEFGVALRDLRTVDPGFRNQMPLVLVRPNALLVSMNDVRAIISTHRMLIFDYERASVKRFIKTIDKFLSPPKPGEQKESDDDMREKAPSEREEEVAGIGLDDSDGLVSGLDLERRRSSSTLNAPFEIRALEASIDHVCSGIERKYSQLNLHVSRALNRALVSNVQLLNADGDAEIDINADTPLVMRDLQSLLPVKHKLRGLSMDCKELSETIQELLDNDEDLDALFLLEGYAAGGSRLPGEHEEAEVMLENHLKRIEQVRNDVLEMRDEVGTGAYRIAHTHTHTWTARLFDDQTWMSTFDSPSRVFSVIMMPD